MLTNQSQLKTELATTALTGVYTPWTEVVASGLTPEKLARILQDASDGNMDAFLTLAEEMEERDPHYASVLGTRKRAIEGLEIDVEGEGEAADALREIVKDTSFTSTPQALMDAVGKGFSAVEIVWEKGARWNPTFLHRDPRLFIYDLATARTLKLRDLHTITGIDLPPYKFIVHSPQLKSGIPIRGGIARLVAWTHLLKSYTLKDWMAFLEVYGMPLRLGKYQGGTEEDIQRLKQAVAGIGHDASAVIPASMDIIFPEVSRKDSSDAFQAMCEWLDRQVSKAVLGQTMTADDGSSRSQAQVHDGVRMDILRADAVALGHTLNQQLVRPFVDLNWGPQKVYPRIQFNLPAVRDVASLSDALSKLVPLGLKVDQEVVRGILGLPDPAEGVDLLEAPKPPVMAPPPLEPTPPLFGGDSAQNRMIPEPQDALDRLAAAALEDWEPAMRPVLNPLAQAALDAPSLEAFRSQLAGLLGQMDTTQLADLLARTTFNARLAGDSGADTGSRASNIQQSSASRLHITVGEPKKPAVRIVPERDNEGRIISYTVHQEEQP